METAEEFVKELSNLCRVMNPWGYGDHDWHAPIAAVESRDAAVALAAKRELLEELHAEAKEQRKAKAPCAYNAAVMATERKYTQPGGVK